MAWLELPVAMLADAADSGSAGTILVGFGCAEGMVSCGVAKKLVVVRDVVVIVVVSGRVGGELFVWGDEEVLLRLVEIVAVGCELLEMLELVAICKSV